MKTVLIWGVIDPTRIIPPRKPDAWTRWCFVHEREATKGPNSYSCEVGGVLSVCDVAMVEIFRLGKKKKPKYRMHDPGYDEWA